jgi:hypothetical protein
MGPIYSVRYIALDVELNPSKTIQFTAIPESKGTLKKIRRIMFFWLPPVFLRSYLDICSLIQIFY